MRVATFNLENLEDKNADLFKRRISILRPQLLRIDADILCLQEVHGQKDHRLKRDLSALKRLIAGTDYETYEMASTRTSNGEIFEKRNLVILSRFPILKQQQLKNQLVGDLFYRRVTAIPKEKTPVKIRWERPALYTEIGHEKGLLHLITLHLKSKIPTHIPGQSKGFGYASVNGWAEGFFLSSMKRVGQAMEVRLMIDKLFDKDQHAKILVCGDFNAEPEEVPVAAIVGSVENTRNPDLGERQLIACGKSISEEKGYTHLHEGRPALIDHMMFSRSLLKSYQLSEIHNEILHDESIAFASDKKYPESDHAPFIVTFKL